MARTPTSPARKEFLAKGLEFVKLVLADISGRTLDNEFSRTEAVNLLASVTSVARHRARIEQVGWMLADSDPNGTWDYGIGMMLVSVGERGYAGLEFYDGKLEELDEMIKELKGEDERETEVWQDLFAGKSHPCPYRPCGESPQADENGVVEEHTYMIWDMCPGGGYDYSQDPVDERKKMTARVAAILGSKEEWEEIKKKVAAHTQNFGTRQRCVYADCDERVRINADGTLRKHRHASLETCPGGGFNLFRPEENERTRMARREAHILRSMQP